MIFLRKLNLTIDENHAGYLCSKKLMIVCCLEQSGAELLFTVVCLFGVNIFYDTGVSTDILLGQQLYPLHLDRKHNQGLIIGLSMISAYV